MKKNTKPPKGRRQLDRLVRLHVERFTDLENSEADRIIAIKRERMLAGKWAEECKRAVEAGVAWHSARKVARLVDRVYAVWRVFRVYPDGFQSDRFADERDVSGPDFLRWTDSGWRDQHGGTSGGNVTSPVDWLVWC